MVTPLLERRPGRSLEEILAEAQTVVEDTDFPTVRRWRDAGGRVVGHFQVYFPEEIAHAAGLLPVKIRGARVEARRAEAAARQALAYTLLGGICLGFAVLLAGPGGSLSGLLADDGRIGAALPVILAACIVAAATKSALVPFHPWLLGAMVAAAPVSGLLHASAMVKAGSYLLLRLAAPIAADGLLGPVLALLGGVTFAVTALQALQERDLKRILAFSTISTLGLIAAAAGLGSAAAVSAGGSLRYQNK